MSEIQIKQPPGMMIHLNPLGNKYKFRSLPNHGTKNCDVLIEEERHYFQTINLLTLPTIVDNGDHYVCNFFL